MNRIFKTTVLAAVLAGGASMAQAGDFDGAYAGVFGRENVNSPTGIDVGMGAFAGYNVSMGNGLVAGIEGEVEYDPFAPPLFGGGIWAPGNEVSGTANVRVGADVDGALVYGKAGVGYSSAGFAIWGAAVGADVPVSEQMFLRAEVQRLDPIPAGPATRYSGKVGIGMNF